MRRPHPADTALIVLAWNVYVANSDRNVEHHLAEWIRDHGPHVIVLNEARGHADVLRRVAREHGYELFQEDPAPKPKVGPIPENGNTAVMVRRDVDVIRRRTVAMRLRWLVVSHNRWHLPRRYEVITLRLDGRRWKVRASHWPTNGFDGRNRAAFRESAVRARAWANTVRTPALIVGDLNDAKARIADFFGRRFTVAGRHIDLLVGRRVADVQHRQLTKGGGDHHARVYTVTPKPR